MRPFITVCWISNRPNHCFQWFINSLNHQLIDTDIGSTKIVAVRDYPLGEYQSIIEVVETDPKPNVWAGKHRLTTQNFFHAASVRNTGLCLAPEGYIAFVDDLSVLLPGWWEQVKLAADGWYVACGTYAKVNKLNVVNGVVESYEDHPAGVDSRKQFFTTDEPFKCSGGWMYGCSMAMPVEALLTVNGFDEGHDSMSGEDTACGIMLERNGFELRMCPKMMTLESEELHHIGVPAKRIIKPYPGYKDSSHAILDWILRGNRTVSPNFQNLRELRQKILAGEPFPIPTEPIVDWRDAAALSGM